MSILSKCCDRRGLLSMAGALTGGLCATAFADTSRVLTAQGLLARQLGAKFDGRTDDSVALQHAIDEAARREQPLFLPSGIARVTAPLDLKGRNISLIGDPIGKTVVKAATRLKCLIDADDVGEAIDSPLFLYGITLDGNRLTDTGLRLRYRHRTVFDTVAVERCDTGFEERDSWLARRKNCRVRDTNCGWRLSGANHSSQWLACSFINAREVHLSIEANGSAQDGNDALLFVGCDVEYGVGDGIRVASGATVTFDTCYLGENIAGDVIVSNGNVRISGGAFFVGHTATSVGFKPEGGTVLVERVAIRGQDFGSLDRLAGVEDAAAPGKIVFRDVDMQLKVGGDPILRGDVLGTTSMQTFAPRYGRTWQATRKNAFIDELSVHDERKVRCSQIHGSNSAIGLTAALSETRDASARGNAYIVIVYAATRPVVLRLTDGSVQKAQSSMIGTLPAACRTATYVKVDVPLNYSHFKAIELTMDAAPGDELTLFHATISDQNIIEPGMLATLAQAR